MKAIFLFLILGSSIICFAAEGASSKLSEPQVLQTGDQMVGLRTGLGNIMGGGPGFGFNYEYQTSKFASFGGQLFLSNYGTGVGGLGTYNYTSTIIIGYASLHSDIFQIQNLDTSASLGIAYNSLKGTWSSSGGADPGTATAGGLSFLIAVNAKYFFSNKWAVTGSLGNFGSLIIGLDYML
jgi:hypothetical protein